MPLFDLASELASLFGHSRVSFIPHGIDTDQFVDTDITKRPTEPLYLLIVGSHMRDLEMVHRLVDYAYFNRWNVKFEFVGAPSTHVSFLGCNNITLSSGISEEDLIVRYQSADALLLPLTASTANNSILESLACGTPVITTNVGGVKDYLTTSAGWILPQGDFTALVDLIQYLCSNKSLCTLKRAAARQQSLKFDWHGVASQYKQLYSRLLDCS